jgi:hypothetical protein
MATILGLLTMSDTDQKKEDDVLRRMLNTPPKPHKPKKEGQNGERRSQS